ncbi:MAG TPA: ferric reductase-like transmembrane domain-containing protein [Kofleriaceae bacterium]|nr:ferric reductase-like transmembrane domain-containing protein [Kofleriaceae bacterium]
MSTSSAFEQAVGAPAAARRELPAFDASFARWFAGVCGLVPLAVLVWDALHGKLGVNGVNYAIRTTGLLGLVFLTITLMITPLRRLTNRPVLIAARRNLGLLGFGYIALHFIIYFWWDREHSVSSTVHEIIAREYLWFGFGALVLMLPLAITSTDAMVARLGAKRWKLLHRLVYVIVGAGVLHYYMQVKADTRQPKAFAAVLAVLLAFRVGWHYLDLRRAAAKAMQRSRAGAGAAAASGPPAPRKFWSGELKVARVFDETPDVRTFRLVAPDGSPPPFLHQPGQYLTLALTIGGQRINRSYTIASSPTRGGHVEITVKRLSDGRGSPHVHASLVEGATVKVSAPAGKFTFDGRGVDRVLLLAGGVGVTPVMAMARYLTDRGWPGHIHFVFSVRTPTDIIFADELAYLARRHKNFHLCIVATQAGDDWKGDRGRVSLELLRREVPDLERTPVYLCGPEPMMDAMRALLIGAGVPAAAIHTEAFVSTPAPADLADDGPALLGAAAAMMTGATRVPSETPVAIRFKRSARDGELSADRTVLEAAEECGVDLPYECRSGVCGQCKTRLVSGEVAMDSTDALSAPERARGLILACQARAITDVVIDA